MDFIKSYLTRALMNPYVCMPNPLKQQALRLIALTLCHNSSTKRQIFDPELDIADDSSPEQVRVQWEMSIKEALTKIVSMLNLPQMLQKQLIDLIRSMALQLLIWSGEWKDLFDIPCNFTADLWLPADWIENRLYERKIAGRLMENDKLTTEQRYRLACEYCLEEYIYSLWNELPQWKKEIYIDDGPYRLAESDVIFAWSKFVCDPESFESDDDFFDILVQNAFREFKATAFIFSWHKFDAETVSYTATEFASLLFAPALRVNFEKILKYNKQVLPFKENLNIQLPKSSGQGDIFCFILMQIHEQKVSGWEVKLKDWEPVVKYCLEWPQEDFCFSSMCNIEKL